MHAADDCRRSWVSICLRDNFSRSSCIELPLASEDLLLLLLPFDFVLPSKATNFILVGRERGWGGDVVVVWHEVSCEQEMESDGDVRVRMKLFDTYFLLVQILPPPPFFPPSLL